MKVSELIEELESLDKDAEIYIALPTHNYWGMVAVKPVSEVAEESIRYSAYLQLNEIVSDEETNSEVEEVKTVYVLHT